MGLGWLSCIIGLILRKLAGLEAMFVLQYSWLTFLWLSSQFLIPFKGVYPLKYTVGYNLPIFQTNSTVT